MLTMMILSMSESAKLMTLFGDKEHDSDKTTPILIHYSAISNTIRISNTNTNIRFGDKYTDADK